MSNPLHDLALATVGAGIALGASALLSAAPAPAALDAPPETRIGMNIVPVLPADAKPPAGQIRQVVGSWVPIRASEDDYWWVNFDQILLYKSEKRG
jgi:hypothetical protein